MTKKRKILYYIICRSLTFWSLQSPEHPKCDNGPQSTYLWETIDI